MKQRRKFSKLVSLSLTLSMLLPSFVMASDTGKVKDTNAIAVPVVQEVKSDRTVDTTSSDQEKTISVLSTADIHGRIYAYDYAVDEVDQAAGLAKIQTIIKQEKAKNPNSILVDAGDTLQDNSADLFNDLPMHPMIQALNTMGYDVWTLGNHEFNFGKDFLDRNIAAFDGDVLATNIYKEDGSHYVKPYTVIEKDGIRVGVIGLTAPHIPRWEASNPENYKGLIFNKVVPEVQKAIKELEGQYDILVGVFHLGMDGEYGDVGVGKIAESCPELSVIFAGHAHAKYDDKEVNGVKIIEPGAYGAALATADIKVVKENDKWKVSDVAVKNIDTKTVVEDKEILTEFKFVHKKSVMNANEVIGTITEDFIKGVDYITGLDKVTTMPTSQMEDTALIDLINEVQLFYADADISSAAAFKNDMNLKAGEFKRKDVANIYKHSNTLVGINLTGKKLKEYMEWSARYYNTYKEGDVTIGFDPEIRGYNYDMFAGITYDINLSEEIGSRIKNAKINGNPIDDAKVYKVAVNNYRYGTLEGLGLVTTADRYYDSYADLQDDGRIRDLIGKYVQEEKNGIVKPEVDNNWKLIGFDLKHPLKDQVYDMIKKGDIMIPASEDGRTLNTKSINVNDLKVQGKIK